MGQEVEIARLEERLRHIDEQVSEVLVSIRGGHGEKGLAEKLFIIEDRVFHLEEEKKENNKGKWTLRTALAAGILSMLTSIFLALLK